MDAMNGATMNAMKRGGNDQRPPRKLIALCLPGRSFAPRCTPIAGSRAALSTPRRLLACHRVVRLSCARLSPNCPPAPASVARFSDDTFFYRHVCRLSSQHRSIVLPACRQSDSLCACGRLDRQAQAPVAQLDRALPSEGKGQRFESPRARHNFNDLSFKVKLPS